MSNFNEKAKTKITQARNKWLVNTQREPYKFVDGYGKQIEISADTLCVPAIHTKHSKEYKPDGKHFIYTHGDDSKHWAVSQEGHMLTFETADLNPRNVGKPDPKTRYVTVFGSTKTREMDDEELKKIRESMEKLHRVIWFSFCANAIQTNTEQPMFVIEDPETHEIIDGNITKRLTMSDLKKLMRQEPQDYKGHPAPKNLKTEYIVHHIDKNKSHNNIENLELMPWWLHDMTDESIHKIAQRWAKKYSISTGKAYATVWTGDKMQKIHRQLTEMFIDQQIENFVYSKPERYFDVDRYIAVIFNSGEQNKQKGQFYRLRNDKDGNVTYQRSDIPDEKFEPDWTFWYEV